MDISIPSHLFAVLEVSIDAPLCSDPDKMAWEGWKQSMSCSRLSQMLDVQPQAESEGTLNEAEDKLKQMRQDCLKWIALRHLAKMQLFPEVFDDILLEMWLIVGNPTRNFACSGQLAAMVGAPPMPPHGWKPPCRMMKAIWAEDERSKNPNFSPRNSSRIFVP